MNLKTIVRLFLSCLCAGSLAVAFMASSQSRPVDPDLIAHEWGTFTSIAGNDGRAVEWAPLTGVWPHSPEAAAANDLPSFVEHFGYAGFKVGLRGTVRMETPVIYLHSPRNVDVSVRVSLSRGLITEWYPHASHVSPAGNPPNRNLTKSNEEGSISWDAVHVQPDLAPDFARENADTHYYAARATSASPVSVETSKGEQRERFLFYRGVSAFSVPLSASIASDGNVLIKNLAKEDVPNLILFERRGEKMGYRVFNDLRDQTSLEPPELNGNIESLYADLEQMLEARGLFPDEAHAMIQTWQNSWFEEGSRLFYIVPRSFVDTILPLTINPAPGRTVRVFVGRIELVTPATQNALEAALVADDHAAVMRYYRFMEPFLKIIGERDPAKGKHLTELLNKSCE